MKKAQKKQSNPSVVVSSVSRVSRKKLVVYGALALLVVFSVAWLVVSRDTKVDPDIATPYSEASPEVAAKKLKKETGVSLDKLKNGDVNDKTLKSYEVAYAGGQALIVADSGNKALQAFAIAENKAGGKATYEFYLDYAFAADIAGKPELAVQLMQKAIAALNADGSVSAQVKKEESEKIQNKINQRQYES